MESSERTYRALLVSANEKFSETLLPLLKACRCEPVIRAGDSATARRYMLEAAYDIIIVNTPLPDEFGTKLALDASMESNTGVMLLVKSEHYADINARVSPYGVLALSKPTSSAMVNQSITLLCATRERLRRMEQKTATIEEKMEEIRIVNRAKWLLVDQLKMTEPDAHRYIEKSAMDRCVTKRAVAEAIIRTYRN